MLNFINEVLAMKCKRILTIPIIAGVLAFVGGLRWTPSFGQNFGCP